MPKKFTLYQSIIIILLSTLLVVSVTYAWTEPSLTPPQGNVSMPLNISSVGQSKAGGLILNTGGAATGLIVANGNVGIGTTVPGSKLHIAGVAPQSIDGLNLSSTDNRGIFLGPSRGGGGSNPLTQAGDSAIIYSAGKNNGAMVIGQWSDYPRGIRIASDGNVGIGTTNPQQKLDVNGSANIGNTLVVNNEIILNRTLAGWEGSPFITLPQDNGVLTISKTGGGNIGSVNINANRVDVNGIIKTQKLQLGDKWLLSGVGDSAANDSWLRLFNQNGTDYYGGIAMNNLWVGSDTYLSDTYLNGNTRANIISANSANLTNVSASNISSWRMSVNEWPWASNSVANKEYVDNKVASARIQIARSMGQIWDGNRLWPIDGYTASQCSAIVSLAKGEHVGAYSWNSPYAELAGGPPNEASWYVNCGFYDEDRRQSGLCSYLIICSK